MPSPCPASIADRTPRTDPADERVGQVLGAGQDDVHAPQLACPGDEHTEQVVQPAGGR